ncbi:MAG TPA: ATP-binding cassette domain-containing protein, partial [Acidimicrobiales bacterium]|nr:ATP-binding cassette domain-containing protein [Acidimicrobiales bacterium]
VSAAIGHLEVPPPVVSPAPLAGGTVAEGAGFASSAGGTLAEGAGFASSAGGTVAASAGADAPSPGAPAVPSVGEAGAAVPSAGAAHAAARVGAARVENRPVVLAVRGARAVGRDGRVLLDGLDLDVREGEIVGLAGVEGNGQKALGDLLASVLDLTSGTVEVDGRAVPAGKAGAMADAGVGMIPEDRHGCGSVLDMSVADNLVMGDLHTVSHRGVLRRRAVLDRAQRLIEEFDISVGSVDAPLRSLSGGNQQRVVLARELGRSPRALVASQPTRGLDVGAIEYMTSRLRQAAASGTAVLLISSELEEILELADRVAVIHRGRIVGEMARAEVDVDRLGLMMGGQAA